MSIWIWDAESKTKGSTQRKNTQRLRIYFLFLAGKAPVKFTLSSFTVYKHKSCRLFRERATISWCTFDVTTEKGHNHRLNASTYYTKSFTLESRTHAVNVWGSRTKSNRRTFTPAHSELKFIFALDLNGNWLLNAWYMYMVRHCTAATLCKYQLQLRNDTWVNVTHLSTNKC